MDLPLIFYLLLIKLFRTSTFGLTQAWHRGWCRVIFSNAGHFRASASIPHSFQSRRAMRRRSGLYPASQCASISACSNGNSFSCSSAHCSGTLHFLIVSTLLFSLTTQTQHKQTGFSALSCTGNLILELISEFWQEWPVLHDHVYLFGDGHSQCFRTTTRATKYTENVFLTFLHWARNAGIRHFFSV